MRPPNLYIKARVDKYQVVWSGDDEREYSVLRVDGETIAEMYTRITGNPCRHLIRRRQFVYVYMKTTPHYEYETVRADMLAVGLYDYTFMPIRPVTERPEDETVLQ